MEWKWRFAWKARQDTVIAQGKREKGQEEEQAAKQKVGAKAKGERRAANQSPSEISGRRSHNRQGAITGPVFADQPAMESPARSMWSLLACPVDFWWTLLNALWTQFSCSV